jgi:thiol-disulfide isomerase/thioredoxin/sugar lactone lactonase YvrE
LDSQTRADIERRARQMLEANARIGIRAPELGGERAWVNTTRPLTLAGDLRGKLVLLDFWTSCCINCLHVLDELRELERRRSGEPFVVVGVHSAKFPGEADPASVRRAVLREGVEHPVVVDDGFELWQQYAVRAWPTQVLVSPDGRVLAQVAGEGQGEIVGVLVGEALALYRDQLDVRPLPLRPEHEMEISGPLRFPGKLVADEAADRLYIADSGHDRIVVTTLLGEFIEAWGGEGPGRVDGPGASARFRNPQGLALWRGALWVADTGNHAVRRVDLVAGTVATVAGTGALGHDRGVTLVAGEAALNSPWDLAPHGDGLLVAMAGTHQVWRLAPDEGSIAPFAGTGAEGRLDGPFEEATLAQPSGLAATDGRVWVADSESSSVRALDLEAGEVRTLAGGSPEPGDLFAFGDADGEAGAVRFQHPLGVARARSDDRDVVLVADTYNHRIRHVDPASGRTATLAGEGLPGALDGAAPQARFREPGGLCALPGRIYVADTANHLVRVVDPERGRVSTLALGSVPLPTPAPPRSAPSAGPLPLPADTRDQGTVRARLAPGTAHLVLAPAPPEGEEPDPRAPLHYRVSHVDGLVGAREPAGTLTEPGAGIELGIAGSGVVEVAVLHYTCDPGGCCYLRGARWRVEIDEDPRGTAELRLT